MEFPEHAFNPEDLLHFVEVPEFTKAWSELGLNDEDDPLALQLMLMAAPKKGPVVKGTGGLRKVRFAPARWHCGKSGAARVCYVYFEEYHIILLVLVYAKNEVDDLSHAAKRTIHKLIIEIEAYLERRGTIS